MEPIATLAASAVSLLSPYLIEAGKKLAESAGGAAWDASARVYEAVKKRLQGSDAAPALAKFEKAPDDADRQAALRAELKDVLMADPAFARALAELMPKAAAGTTTLNFDNKFAAAVNQVVQAHTVTITKDS